MTTPHPPGDTLPPEQLEPLAALAAIAFPGAGYFVLGEARRGLLVMVGIMGLFLSGLFVGGIDVIDREEDTIWFVGQACVGPLAFGVDYIHQTRFKGVDSSGRHRAAYPYEAIDHTASPRQGQFEGTPAKPKSPPARKSVARMNEIGTLFCTLAGFMNIIVVLDCLLHRPGGGGAPASAPPRVRA